MTEETNNNDKIVMRGKTIGLFPTKYQEKVLTDIQFNMARIYNAYIYCVSKHLYEDYLPFAQKRDELDNGKTYKCGKKFLNNVERLKYSLPFSNYLGTNNQPFQNKEMKGLVDCIDTAMVFVNNAKNTSNKTIGAYFAKNPYPYSHISSQLKKSIKTYGKDCFKVNDENLSLTYNCTLNKALKKSLESLNIYVSYKINAKNAKGKEETKNVYCYRIADLNGRNDFYINFPKERIHLKVAKNPINIGYERKAKESSYFINYAVDHPNDCKSVMTKIITPKRESCEKINYDAIYFPFAEGEKYIKISHVPTTKNVNTSVTFKKVADKWYLSYSYKSKKETIKPTNVNCGLDWGIKDNIIYTVYDSNDVTYKIKYSDFSLETIKKFDEKITNVQKRMESLIRQYYKNKKIEYNTEKNGELRKAYKPSKHYKQLKIEFTKLNKEKTDFLDYIRNTITKIIVEFYDHICIEDLSPQQMLHNDYYCKKEDKYVSKGEYKKILNDSSNPLHNSVFYKDTVFNKKIHINAPSTFKMMLEQKAEIYGKEVCKCKQNFASSKTCSYCRKFINYNLKLGDRTWVCQNCKINLDRDANAARNLLIEGINQMNNGGNVGLVTNNMVSPASSYVKPKTIMQMVEDENSQPVTAEFYTRLNERFSKTALKKILAIE